MTTGGEMSPQYGVTTPRPDPTAATTVAVDRATEQWRRELAAAMDTINARLDAMAEADGLRMDGLREIRPMVERQINHLRELHDARFTAIEQRFGERDIRFDQAAKAGKDALDLALQSAKELVNAQGEAAAAAAVKAEGNTTKQIDQITTLILSNQKASDARWQELKERIDRDTGGRAAVADVVTTRRLDAGQVLMAVSVVVAAIAVIVTVVIATHG